MHELIALLKPQVEVGIDGPSFCQLSKHVVFARFGIVYLRKELVLLLKKLLDVFLMLNQLVLLSVIQLLHFRTFSHQDVALLSNHTILILVPGELLLDLVLCCCHFPQLLGQTLISVVCVSGGL